MGNRRVGLVGAAVLAALLVAGGCGEETSSGQRVASGGAGGAVSGGMGKAGGVGWQAGGMGQGSSKIDKVDVLMVIDNSASMADKQQLLAKAVPELIGRLVNPDCVLKGPTGQIFKRVPRAEQPKSAGEACPVLDGEATVRELPAMSDVHVGVVTSSLGGHGADICPSPSEGTMSPTKNDRGRLINRAVAKRADGSPDPGNYTAVEAGEQGFLGWTPGADGSGAALSAKAAALIEGADQIGCGYEAPLEAWYRFLIEPDPPEEVRPDPSVLPGAFGPLLVTGTDGVLLAQREEFLRPDSLVAVIMLSDENDCSIIDGVLPATVCEPKVDAKTGNPIRYDAEGNPILDPNGKVPVYDPRAGGAFACEGDRKPWSAEWGVQGNFTNASVEGDGSVKGDPFFANYLLAQQTSNGNRFRLKSGTKACETDPYGAACQQCYTSGKTDCDEPKSDADDPLQLRCWNAKARFGWDPLYPTQRYSKAVSSLKIHDRDGFLVPNPLFDDLPYNKAVREGRDPGRSKFKARQPQLIFFAGIVGVPWQDIAVDPTDLSKGYRPTVRLHEWEPEPIDWDLILGDPFYRDEGEGRGRKPRDPVMVETTGVRSGKHPVTGEEINDSSWNSVNGHEWNAAGENDLQYACIFELNRTDEQASCVGKASCDCQQADEGRKNPLCEDRAYGDSSAEPKPQTVTQRRAKAYPGTRQLQVLKEVGANVVVASVCAVNTKDEGRDDFGYRPVVQALINEIVR